jgi:AraC-like DNA-binding protein
MSAGTADFASLRFSTRALPERDRIPMWREEFGRGVVRVDIEPLSDVPFHAEAILRRVPGLRTIACTGAAAAFQRTPALAADGDDSVTLFVNVGTRALASQRGQDVVLAAGDAVPIFHGEPAVVTSLGSYFAAVVPHSALASRVRNFDDLAMRLIPRRTEALRLLMSYVNLTSKKAALAPPELRDAVATHVHELAALAITTQGALGERSLSAVAAARLDAALDQIAESFDAPGLSVGIVARKQGISPRDLQRLIETTGTSFTARVNELRLQKAFTLLTQACDSGRCVSDIALQSGFSDVSHFNRLFRSRFADTPSGVRGARKPTSS